MAGAAEGRTDAWYFLEVCFVEFVDDRYWLQDAAPESSDVPCFTTRDGSPCNRLGIDEVVVLVTSGTRFASSCFRGSVVNRNALSVSVFALLSLVRGRSRQLTRRGDPHRAESLSIKSRRSCHVHEQEVTSSSVGRKTCVCGEHSEFGSCVSTESPHPTTVCVH